MSTKFTDLARYIEDPTLKSQFEHAFALITATVDQLNLLHTINVAAVGGGLDYAGVTIAQGANNALQQFGNAGSAKAVTQTDDVNLYQNNVTLTPPGSGSKEYKFFRNYITTAGGADVTAYVKISYNKIKVSTSIRTCYILQNSLEFTANGLLAEAGYIQANVVTLNNTSQLGGEVYCLYLSVAGSGAGGALNGTYGIRFAMSHTGIIMTAAIDMGPSASCTLTSGIHFGGEGTLTNGLNINMGSGTGMVYLLNFSADKVGNAVKVGAAITQYASDGAFKIKVNTTDYYVPFYTLAHTTGGW